MNTRLDRIVALLVNRLAKEAGKGTVAIIGSIRVNPGATNIICKKALSWYTKLYLILKRWWNNEH